MPETSAGRRPAFRAAIETFLQQRLDAKLDKLDDDDPNRETLRSQHRATTWLDDAARRVIQIQAVTHSLKPIHPDARGTNLYCRPDALAPHAEIGSHALGPNFTGDVVGNAAALDVYKLLKLEVDGRTLLDAMLANDADLVDALGSDAVQVQSWIDAFTGLTRPRSEGATSHTRAKQLYWLTGDDPLADDHYQLLAPLYASSLAHAVFQMLNEDRFGDESKEARLARREHREYATGFREYPSLAVQKLGGTKPQNVSQLNSERGGNNYLLGSLPPPPWEARLQLLPKPGQTSIFDAWGRKLSVWEAQEELTDFLVKKPGKTMPTRDSRDDLSNRIIDTMLAFAATVQQLPPGWSAKPGCDLDENEKLWLDPFRCELDLEFRKDWLWWDWPQRVCDRFGNWLNEALKQRLTLGKDEEATYRHWGRELAHHPDWLFELDELKAWLADVEKREVQPGGAS